MCDFTLGSSWTVTTINKLMCRTGSPIRTCLFNYVCSLTQLFVSGKLRTGARYESCDASKVFTIQFLPIIDRSDLSLSMHIHFILPVTSNFLYWNTWAKSYTEDFDSVIWRQFPIYIIHNYSRWYLIIFIIIEYSHVRVCLTLTRRALVYWVKSLLLPCCSQQCVIFKRALHELTNQYQACLYLFEFIYHDDSKYGHGIPKCWHFF